LVHVVVGAEFEAEDPIMLLGRGLSA